MMRRRQFIIRLVAGLFVVAAVGLAGYATFKSSDKADEPVTFADRTTLSGLWDNYKQEYWEESTGRTIDKQQNNITTSEGQGYTMLRAVWQSDKATFDTSWKWTQEQLQRKDGVFSWRWGKHDDGSYGILKDVGGQNTAADGDSDIALALVMAASRWQDQSYLNDAREVITGMWDTEVITVKDTPYLASNNLEKDSKKPALLNPSYFAPYAYRIFADVDTKHDWNKLVGSSYDVINRSIDAKLDKSHTAGLVPDWVALNRTTGKLQVPTVDAENITTNYSYDAMRTAWRLGLDYQWNNEPKAKQTLGKLSFLSDTWDNDQTLVATYSHDGKALTTDEPSEVYGTAMGYFMTIDQATADEVYKTKLISLYDATNNSWTQPMSYYSDNWTWFGIALHDKQLPNLTKES